MFALGYIRCPTPSSDSQRQENMQPAVNVQVNFQINIQLPPQGIVTFVPIYNFPKFLVKNKDHVDIYKPMSLDDVEKMLGTSRRHKTKGKIFKLKSSEQQAPDRPVATRVNAGPQNQLAAHLRNFSLQLQQLASSLETSGHLVPNEMAHRRSNTSTAGQGTSDGQSPQSTKITMAGGAPAQLGGDESSPNDISQTPSIAQENQQYTNKRLETEQSVDPSVRQSGHERRVSFAGSNSDKPQQSAVENMQLGQERDPAVTCPLCVTSPPDSVFLPCGHGGLCSSCSRVIHESGKCCYCRE